MDWFWKGRKDIEVEGVERVEEVEGVEGVEEVEEVEGVEEVEWVEEYCFRDSSRMPLPTMTKWVLGYR